MSECLAGNCEYNPNQDYNQMMAYSDYMGTLAGKGDWEGGCTIWMCMALVGMMMQFTADTVGMDAFIDQDINDIKALTEDLNSDLNAGRSKQQDAYGNYYVVIDNKVWYCDADAKVKNSSGQMVTVNKEDTLAYKIQGDVDNIKYWTAQDPYFQDNPELMNDINHSLDDYMNQINSYNGNIHDMWYDTDPQYYTTEINGTTYYCDKSGNPMKNADGTPKTNDTLGDASIMQPMTDDLMAVQKQYENGDSVMQSILKSLTSLEETEQSMTENMDKSLTTMEGTMTRNQITQ